MNAAQTYQLELLKFVKDIAKKNNLTYWIDGGTLLGAARSQSFIPWDNDIDICFPKRDYDSLIDILKRKCKTHIYYSLFYNEELDYWTNYLGDCRLLENGLLPVRVDLIPVIGLQDLKQVNEFKNSLNDVCYLIKNKYKYDIVERKNLDTKRTTISQKSSKISTFNKQLNRYADLNESSNITYSFHDVLVKKERSFYNYEQLFPVSNVKFEGEYFSCPGDVDSYLTVLYGKNYLTPPDPKKQISNEYKYTKNKLPKSSIEKIVNLHLQRDYLAFNARNKPKLLRPIYKIFSFASFSIKSIMQGCPVFIFMQARYSLYKLLKIIVK